MNVDDNGGPAHFTAAAVAQTLGRSTDVDACVALARRVAGLMGQALQFFQDEPGGEPAIACRAGCHFCCHLHVMVYPHEAIALHRYLGAQLPAAHAQRVRERLTDNAAQLRQPHESLTAMPRRACAFLIDGRCSVYEVRPAACAGYHSLRREACEADHQARNSNSAAAGGGIPVLQALRQVSAAASEGLQIGLNTLGLPGTQVELQTTVAALLEEPALIGRWRGGREWPRDAKGVMRTKK